MGRHEPLQPSWRAMALHRPFPLSEREMTVFSPIVEALVRPMIQPRRNLSLEQRHSCDWVLLLKRTSAFSTRMAVLSHRTLVPQSLHFALAANDHYRALGQNLDGGTKVLCGWLLHCKRFFGDFSGHFVSTVVCPACLCGGVPLALMNSASKVPIG